MIKMYILLLTLFINIESKEESNYFGSNISNRDFTFAIINSDNCDTIYRHYPYKSENKIDILMRGVLNYQDNHYFNNNYYLLENFSIVGGDLRSSSIVLSKYSILDNKVIFMSKLKINKLSQKGAYTDINSKFDKNVLTISYVILTYPKAISNNKDIVINLENMKIIQE